MTILDRMRNESNENQGTQIESKETISTKLDAEVVDSTNINEMEQRFNQLMNEFNVNAGFKVGTGTPPSDTMLEILSSKDVMVSITILLSYIRYCVNNGVKKDITVKIGYNKPPNCPMNFAINDEMIDDIYPGDVVEIN